MRVTYHLHCKASRTSAITLKRRHVIRFAYSLHCKASRTSAIQSQGVPRDSVHLPSALQSEPNVSNTVLKSHVIRFTYLLHIAKRAERQPYGLEVAPRHSLTNCIASEPKFEREPYGLKEARLHDWFTHILHCKGQPYGLKEAPPDSVHLLVAASEPNVSHTVSERRHVIQFTYELSCKGSRTPSAIRSQKGAT